MKLVPCIVKSVPPYMEPSLGENDVIVKLKLNSTASPDIGNEIPLGPIIYT